MKSYPGSAAGNINLHGRKHVWLRCGCCEVQDIRDRANDNEIRREIDEARTNSAYRRELRDEAEMLSLTNWEDEIFDRYWREYLDAA